MLCGKDGSDRLAVVGWRYKGGTWWRGQRGVLAPEGANEDPGWICSCEDEENVGKFPKCLDATASVALQWWGESPVQPESGIPLLTGRAAG